MKRLYAGAIAAGGFFAVWLIGVIDHWFPMDANGNGPGAFWVGGVGVFAAMALVLALGLARLIAQEHGKNAEKRRDAADLLALRFRQVYTVPQGNEVTVLVKGGDIGQSPRQVGRFHVADEDRLLDCVTVHRQEADVHRQEVLAAERLSRTVNR